MAATLATTIPPGKQSSEFAVTPNKTFSVQSTSPVIIYGKLNSTPVKWVELARLNRTPDCAPIIATCEMAIVFNPGPVDVYFEVYA